MRSRSGDGPVGVPGETTRLQLLLVSMRAGAGPGQAGQHSSMCGLACWAGQAKPWHSLVCLGARTGCRQLLHWARLLHLPDHIRAEDGDRLGRGGLQHYQ